MVLFLPRLPTLHQTPTPSLSLNTQIYMLSHWCNINIWAEIAVFTIPSYKIGQMEMRQEVTSYVTWKWHEDMQGFKVNNIFIAHFLRLMTHVIAAVTTYVRSDIQGLLLIKEVHIAAWVLIMNRIRVTMLTVRQLMKAKQLQKFESDKGLGHFWLHSGEWSCSSHHYNTYCIPSI